MFKLGVLLDSFRAPLKESLCYAKDLGLSGVQLYASSGRYDVDNFDEPLKREVGGILRDSGLVFSAICGDMGGHGFAIKSENTLKIAKSKRILDLANYFGCHIITTHIGVIPEDRSCERYAVMQSAMRELAEYAVNSGSYFAIETGPEKVKTLKQFLKDVNSKGIAVNYDPANFHMVTHEDEVKGVYELAEYIVHTHAKDGLQGEKFDTNKVYDFFATGGIEDMNLREYFCETPLGKGGVDFDRYFKALKDIGYNGYITIEREVAEKPYDDILLAVDFLRSKLDM